MGELGSGNPGAFPPCLRGQLPLTQHCLVVRRSRATAKRSTPPCLFMELDFSPWMPKEQLHPDQLLPKTEGEALPTIHLLSMRALFSSLDETQSSLPSLKPSKPGFLLPQWKFYRHLEQKISLPQGG